MNGIFAIMNGNKGLGVWVIFKRSFAFLKMQRVFGLIILGLCACTPDPCETRICLNGGVCLDGKCTCPEGFIGPDCGISLDPCDNLVCATSRSSGCISSGGEARCLCLPGYEGKLCDSKWSARFAGNFTALENCNTGPLSYEMEILEGPILRQITFANFHNGRTNTETAKVVANLINPDGRAFDIYEQYMYFGLVSGSGRIRDDNNTLDVNFRIINNKDTIDCSATFTRR